MAHKLFKSKGYKVASVARTTKASVSKHSDLCLTADFSDPSSVDSVYKKVEKELGVPNVVVYNPYSWSKCSDPANPVSPSLQDFQRDLAINTGSAYAAAQAAVKGFKKLPRTVKKTFIYTGNNGISCIVPQFLLLGIGKISTWYMIQSLVAAPVSVAEGFRFYFADERTPEGKASPYISGPGHAEFFLQLAEQDGQSEALATFVRGKGYVAFEQDKNSSLPSVAIQDILNPRYGAPGTAEARYGY